jgi:hypothetical protein
MGQRLISMPPMTRTESFLFELASIPDRERDVPARLTRALPFSSHVLPGCHVAEHSEQNSFVQLGHLTSTEKGHMEKFCAEFGLLHWFVRKKPKIG